MDLQAILNKSKALYISVTDKDEKLIDSIEKDTFDYKKELTTGGNFFLKSGSDFFTKVLNEKQIEQLLLTSQDTSILFIKNTKLNLLFSLYSKNELNPNIIKLIIEKYVRNN